MADTEALSARLTALAAMASVEADIAQRENDRIVAAARKAGSHSHFYNHAAEHWLQLKTIAAMNAAFGAISNSAVLSAIHEPRIQNDLLEVAFDAAKKKLWQIHYIIDALPENVDAAALHGVETALDAYPDAIEALAASDRRFTTPAP